MYLAQHYLECLSQASYLVGDEESGNAVVVDPRRDIQDYVDDAAARGLRVVGVINTHFHADFLSGHLEMAQATGAWIGYGAAAETDFEIRALADGQRIGLGESDGVVLQIMETPGHTPESISILVYERASDATPYGVLTGDTLFIGDVGRPDLLASPGATPADLGRLLYHSVQGKLLSLPDEVRVFPAHGAGSACGKMLSTARQSTIGEQRRLNYACQPMSEDEFVALVCADQAAVPEYFAYDALLNRKRRAVLADARVPRLDLAETVDAIAAGVVPLDVRDAEDFTVGHLRGSISIPLDGRFAETAGMLLSPDDRIIVIASDDQLGDAVKRLARIGFDRVVGHLGAIEEALASAAAHVRGSASRLAPAALVDLLADRAQTVCVVDVRNGVEREDGVIPGTLSVPMAELRRRIHEIPRDRTVVLHCEGGWRSSVAASYLRRTGYEDVSDLRGGYAAWRVQHGLR